MERPNSSAARIAGGGRGDIGPTVGEVAAPQLWRGRFDAKQKEEIDECILSG
jgi:hypothetical protein